MQLFLLDGGILDVLRVWLEPYEDGTLASIDLKDAILEVLNKMDIETDHLKESGIGKVIMFMYKCPREISSIRRKSNELINKWSRPILGQGMLPPPPAVQSSAQTRGVANGAGYKNNLFLHFLCSIIERSTWIACMRRFLSQHCLIIQNDLNLKLTLLLSKN